MIGARIEKTTRSRTRKVGSCFRNIVQPMALTATIWVKKNPKNRQMIG
jgi:hypothetical protein